jgi:hypothetical protein
MKVSKKDVSLLVAHIVNSLQEQINTLSLVSYQIEPQDNSMPKLKMAHLIINGKHWYYYTYDQKDLFAIVVRDTPVTAVPVN